MARPDLRCSEQENIILQIPIPGIGISRYQETATKKIWSVAVPLYHYQSIALFMAKIKHVTPSVAFEMTKKGALFVDVREEGEIARKAFDVPEIMAVPLSRFQSGFKKIPVNRKVILVCRSGNRSSTATNMLMSHSYKNVSNLQGGIIDWERAGLPVKKKRNNTILAKLLTLFGRHP